MFKVELLDNKLCLLLDDIRLIEFNSGDFYLDLYDCLNFVYVVIEDMYPDFCVQIDNKSIFKKDNNVEFKIFEFFNKDNKNTEGKFLWSKGNFFSYLRNGFYLFIKKGFTYEDHKNYILENKFKREKILCAAMHIQNDINHKHSPKNVSTGYVISGFRHHNCLEQYHYTKKDIDKFSVMQGFLTSKNRFVDRKEAKILAFILEQIAGYKLPLELFSEDLY